MAVREAFANATGWSCLPSLPWWWSLWLPANEGAPRKAVAQEKLRTFEPGEMEKRETGSFWNCVMATMSSRNVTKAEQFQRVSSQPTSPSKRPFRLLTPNACQDRTRATVLRRLRDAPTELAAHREIPRHFTQAAIGPGGLRGETQNAARSKTWTSSSRRPAMPGTRPQTHTEAVAFEKFFTARFRSKPKLKEPRPARFCRLVAQRRIGGGHDRLRADFGGLLNVSGQVKPRCIPSRSPRETTASCSSEEDQLQVESCGKRSRKGRRRRSGDSSWTVTTTWLHALACQ